MAEKQINGRIVHKHDTEANWNKATNFIPKKGEIIVYDPDSSYTYSRVKVGDGTTKVTSLPFIDNAIKTAQTNLSDTVDSVKNNSITGLSVSGQTITYTKGSGATGTITTQDNNTTYSAGTGLSLSGTTFNHKNSITAATAQGSATKTLTFGDTFTIPTITYDAQGHITGKGTTTMTMPVGPVAKEGNPVSEIGIAGAGFSAETTFEPKQEGSGIPYPAGGGKNLLPPAIEKTITNNGVTFTSDGKGRYTINGTATGSNAGVVIDLVEPITIGEVAPYCHLLNPVANVNISFSFIRPDGTQITWLTTSSVNRIKQLQELAGEKISKINLFLGKDNTANNFTLTPMFCTDDVPATFEPYSNIRPISGWTDVQLIRCRKNLLDLSQGYSYGLLKPLSVPAGTPITFSLFPTNGTLQFNIRIKYEDDTEYHYGIIGKNNSNSIWYTYTITPEKQIKGYSLYDTDSSNKRTISKGMIEYGSTATAYEPYQGNTFTTDFGQTVYGGTLDWNRGVLTVEWAMITLTGNETWEPYASSGAFLLGILTDAIIPNYTEIPQMVCSHYAAQKRSDIASGTNVGVGIGGATHLIVYPGSNYTADTFKSYIATQYAAGTPVQVCYKLATPTTIQLTPHDLRMISGTNTVYSDGNTNYVIFNSGASSLAQVNKNYLKLTGGTLTGYLVLQNNPVYPRLLFKSSSYDGSQGEMFYYMPNNAASSYFHFRQFCRSSEDYSLLSTYEDFKLPQTTADRTSSGYYNILTTKSAVTIAQGGTGATTASGARTNLEVPSKTGDGASGTWGSDINGTASKANITTTNPSSGTIYPIPFMAAITGSNSLLANDGIGYWTQEGTTSATGTGKLKLGNNKASGTAGNKKGYIYMYGTSSGYTEIIPANNTTSNITVNLPSSSGTIALTSSNITGNAATATLASYALKMQTYKQGSTTETYGTSYPLYAQWENANVLKLKCDNFTVKTDTATKLATARTLTIGNTGKTFDGSGNVSWSLSEIGALPLSGGTVTGRTYFNQGIYTRDLTGGSGTAGYMYVCQIVIGAAYTDQPIYFKISQRNRFGEIILQFNNVNSNDPTLSTFVTKGTIKAYIVKSATSTWDLYIEKSGSYDSIAILDMRKGGYMMNVSITWKDSTVTSLPTGYKTAELQTYAQNISGNAATATKFATARTISLTGSVTGSGSFDGSDNLSIATTTNHTHSYLPLSGGTLTGFLTLQNSATYPCLDFKSTSYNSELGTIFYTVQSNSYKSNFFFRQYSRSSTNYSILSNYEDFALPSVTADRTSYSSYSILTTKSTVTVAQGGTGATTASGARTNLGIIASTTAPSNPTDGMIWLEIVS